MRDILIKFLDEIREYEHESGNSMYNDDRESSEIVDIHLESNPKLKSMVASSGVSNCLSLKEQMKQDLIPKVWKMVEKEKRAFRLVD